MKNWIRSQAERLRADDRRESLATAVAILVLSAAFGALALAASLLLAGVKI
jgi:hypothetical protein